MGTHGSTTATDAPHRAGSSQVAPARKPAPCVSLSDPLRESYQTLLHRIAWPANDKGPLLRTLGLTSSEPGEGVSTVAAQLAVVAATGSPYRVLLVDANLARPTVHRLFELPLTPGLADVVSDPTGASEAIRPTALPNLSVLCAGKSESSAWLDGGELSEAFEAVRTGHDLVVVDLPAVGQSSAALRWARLLDGVILVVEAERVRGEVVQRVKQRLAGANATLLGAVLNKQREHLPGWLNRNL